MLELRKLSSSINVRIKDDYIEYVIFNGRCILVNNKNEVKLLPSLSRARKNAKMLIALNMNEYASLVTLTFSDEIFDYDLAGYYFTLYNRRLKRRVNDLKYIAFMELQNKNRDGVIHYHILYLNEEIFNMDRLEIYHIWGNGRTHKENVIDINDFTIDKISNYLSKYLNKGEDQLIDVNKKMYFTTRNLIRENEVIKMEYSVDSVANILCKADIEVFESKYVKKILIKLD